MILRVALSGFVVYDAFAPEKQGAPLLRNLTAYGFLFLALGVWTPVIALTVALLEVWIAAEVGQLWPFAMASATGIALAFIGPGAHSIDAKRFGRKRVVFEERGGQQSDSFESEGPRK